MDIPIHTHQVEILGVLVGYVQDMYKNFEERMV